MKRILFLCACICATLAVFSQADLSPKKKFTNQQIVDMLNLSLEANGALTIEDLNKIYPGDQATFPLKNGKEIVFLAEYGDTYWKFGKIALEYQAKHPENPIITPAPVSNPTNPKKKDESVIAPGPTKLDGNFWLLILILEAIAVVASYLLLKKKKKKEDKSSTESTQQENLIPLVANGVSNEGAPSYMQQVAARQRLILTGPTERGLLTTKVPINMAYVGAQRMENFTNEPFFRAPARKEDGTEGHSYFRQTCGNDGIFIKDDDIIWTADQVQSPALLEANRILQQPTPAQQGMVIAGNQNNALLAGNFAAVVASLGGTVEKIVADNDKGEISLVAHGFEFRCSFGKNVVLPTNHLKRPEPAENFS